MRHADPQLEARVLGALLDSETWRTSAATLLGETALQLEDFSDDAHRTVFGAIRALSERGRPTDAGAVWPLIRDTGAESTQEALAALQNANQLSPESFRIQAAEMRRMALLRRLEGHYREQLRALSAQRPDPVAISAAADAFNANFAASVEGDEPGDADIHELGEEWDAFLNGKREPYLRTGIQAIDAIFGGFVPNLNLVGGRASIGKTALVAEMVWNWLNEGHRVGVFGLEDGTRWLIERHMSRALGIPVGAIAASRMHEYQWATYAERAAAWAPMLRDRLCVFRRAGISAPELLATAKRWIHVKRVRAIVIDHGGEVRHQNPGAKDRYDLAVKSTMEGLRDLAHNSKTPIIVLWHLNREGAKLGQPTMESFKESGYLEAMSRTMLGLWEREQSPGQMLVTVVKATKGRRDVTCWVPRDEQHALVHSVGGGAVDLREEAEAARSRTPARARSIIGGLHDDA